MRRSTIPTPTASAGWCRTWRGETQFLFISHNKITMEMANQLIGITMPEPGISRVVAVDIAEALELAGSTRRRLNFARPVIDRRARYNRRSCRPGVSPRMRHATRSYSDIA